MVGISFGAGKADGSAADQSLGRDDWAVISVSLEFV